MKLNSNHYESPVLSVLDTEVENGFAASGGEYSIDAPDMVDGGSF